MNPYIPSTDAEREEMLRSIGAPTIESLLEQVPEALRWRPGEGEAIPGIAATSQGEMEVVAEARRRAASNVTSAERPSFVGAGLYRHYIPAVVPHLATRSEFLTAYTPYQPEASQGFLQATFEFQTLIARLTGMEVSNAGLYDGATAVAEAVLMGLSARPSARRVVVSRAVHPQYREVVRSHVEGLGAEVVEVDAPEGVTPLEGWGRALEPKDSAAIAVFQSPGFFGCIENGAQLVQVAHEFGAVGCVVFNPIAVGILVTPGDWRADIAVGEGQPLGLSTASGGETLGLFATRKEFMWKMPGRLVGLTRDRKDRRAFVLTLQSREQHIRRAKATSNICTNQALFALMATIYLATVGPEGLREVATLCASRAAYAKRRLSQVRGVRLAFAAPTFHEFVIRTWTDAEDLVRRIAHTHGILPGYPIGRDYPELRDALLVCVTEMNSIEDIDRLAAAIAHPDGA